MDSIKTSQGNLEERPYEVETFQEPEKGDGAYALRPAGFIRRAIAYSVDIVVLFVLLEVFFVAGLIGLRYSGGGGDASDYSDLGISLLNNLLFIAIGYFTFFHSHCGQTPGKMILRIEVVTKTHKWPSPLQSFFRTLCYLISGFFFGLGFFITAFERKKRALHDHLSGTQVILSP